MSQQLRERARSNMAATLPDTGSVYRISSQGASADFGDTTTFTLLDTHAANFWSITGQEALVLARLDVRASVTVELPYDADVTERDQLVYTETETGAIHHFEISFVHDRSRRLTKRLSCIEYKFGEPS